MDITSYPFLTRDEFAEACHNLDRQYCRATLGPIRQRWKLRVVTALDISLYSEVEYVTYVQIIRPIEADHADLSAEIERMTLGISPAELGIDQAMMEDEESDKAALQREPLSTNGWVTYEIHFHPTYRAPCLWFSIRDLANGEPTFDVETVFRHLVPQAYKDGLRKIGGVGGISVDHHPVTGVSSFFVHPCLLGDAMAGFEGNKENYLMIWLGLVGGCVGLWVPKEMALS